MGLSAKKSITGAQKPRQRVALSPLSMMQEIECDVLIVGGGPAGCTCALYTARAGLHTVLVDKNPATGALAITSTIANYPGVDTSTSGRALLDKMREQAIDFGTDYRRSQVFMVECDGGDRKCVYTPDGTFKARALVLATGAMGRPPSFKGEDTYLGNGVSYCATCDAAFCRDQEVAVVGVNQEAKDEARVLTKFAKIVHWITPSAPRPDDVESQELLAHPNVQHWSGTRLLSVDGDATGLTGLTLKKSQAESSQVLPVEMVFIYAAGSKPVTDFITDQNIVLKEDGGVKVDEEMATSVPGVYAIGDIRNTPFKQVVVAASEGCIAAMSIDKYLAGRKKVRVDWVHDAPENIVSPMKEESVDLEEIPFDLASDSF